MPRTFFLHVHPLVVYFATPFVVVAIYVTVVLYLSRSNNPGGSSSPALGPRPPENRRLFEMHIDGIAEKGVKANGEVRDALAFVLSEEAEGPVATPLSYPPSPSLPVKPERFFFLEVPQTGPEFISAFAANAHRYNNVSWCANKPWRRPPRFDHVCERMPAVITDSVKQVRTVFGDGLCGGLRMIWDFSLIDNVLVLSRKTFRLVTVLRHPVRRIADAYYGTASSLVTSLREFAVSEALHFQKYGSHNHQVRQFAGILYRCSQYSPEKLETVRRDPLSAAKRNLLTFDAIGIYERMNETLRLFRHLFGWGSEGDSDESMSLESAGLRMAKVSYKVSKEDTEFIENANSLEMEFYAYGVTLFEEQMRNFNI
eukprot:m.117764 g.117764  ORF g.117764 m.117764 type:complete len:370 (+) comp37628_c0_seq5:3200-4309(+)